MDETVVIFERLSKAFIIKKNPVDSIKLKVMGLFDSRYREKKELFWALKNINLNVNKGEFLGLVGPNGSGKSTLLRMIAGIYCPTQGTVEIHGRVVPMIELGIGFHQDLNGRENIYLSTSLYGLSKKETDRIIDEIIDFSELGEFIEQPAKNYSLGMYMRLGFATAINLDPEILLIDEVLAVGDEYFQQKCLKKMNEIHRKGKTIILVSHDLKNIEKMCTRACLLYQGMIIAEGKADNIVKYYKEMVAHHQVGLNKMEK